MLRLPRHDSALPDGRVPDAGEVVRHSRSGCCRGLSGCAGRERRGEREVYDYTAPCDGFDGGALPVGRIPHGHLVGVPVAPHTISKFLLKRIMDNNMPARQHAACRTARCRHRAFLGNAAHDFEKLEAMLYNKFVYRLLAEKEVIPEVLEKLAVD